MSVGEAKPVNLPEEFREKKDLKTRALEIDGVLLWVCPEELASKSSVFMTLFFGDYHEKNKEVIQLKGQNLEEFITFLLCVNARQGYLEAIRTKPFSMLKLADEFDTPDLVYHIFHHFLQEWRYQDPHVHCNTILKILSLAYHHRHQEALTTFFTKACSVSYKRFVQGGFSDEICNFYYQYRCYCHAITENEVSLTDINYGQVFFIWDKKHEKYSCEKQVCGCQYVWRCSRCSKQVCPQCIFKIKWYEVAEYLCNCIEFPGLSKVRVLFSGCQGK